MFKKFSIILLATFLVFTNTSPVYSEGFSFTQTDWSSGQTTNIANHTDNQTGWAGFSTKDANITALTDVQLNNSTYNTHITFDSENDYVQEDAINGTDFSGGSVILHGSGVSATGGTVSTDSGDTVHKFTSGGNFTVTNGGNVEVIVVAGGGGGGGHGGQCLDEPAAAGGGGGGVVHRTNYVVQPGIYAITVGNGGAAGAYNPYGGDNGGAGGNSTFDTLTALGGGGGGSAAGSGGNGGSGGGSGGCGYTRAGGLGIQPTSTSGGYGNNGASGILQGPTGGGGGAGGAGGARVGGSGINIHGTNYAAGGYAGGSAAGAASTGNGGAGSTKFGTGGAGGSGVVIVRYSGSLTYPTTSRYVTTHTNSQKNTSMWGAISNISTTQTTPTSTNIKYAVSFDNKSTWQYWDGSSWQNTSLATLATNGMTNAVLENITEQQWAAVFTSGTFDIAASLMTSDATVTPILDNIQISYAIPQTQILTSNIYNAQTPTAGIAQLTWNEILSTNTDIQFQLRTSPDGINWSSWCGPDDSIQGSCNTSTYFTDPQGTETIDDILADGINDQYMQYRVQLSSSDGQNTPSLSDITLAYQTSTDITIPDPNTTKIQSAVTNNYMTLDNGTITNTTQSTTRVNIILQNATVRANFPVNTHITESNNNNFNFQNFTLLQQNVQSEQPTSVAGFRLGIDGTNLNFSQDVTVVVSVSPIYNDHTLDILYQNEGETTWNTQGTCTVTNGACTFTTNHATIYTINGIHQATGNAPMNLNVQVEQTLSMDCFDPSDSNTAVSLGTTANPGMITAGTPATGQSRCTVTTNADQGYYLTITNSNPAHATLTHTDPNTSTLYEIQDTTPWDENTKATTNWNAPTTKGLGFSVISFPEADTSHNQFNGVWTETGNCPEGTNADANDYAGIPTSPQTISAVTSYQTNATTTDICYKVDVLPSQPSGQYSGQVTFTATSDASGYWE